MLFTISYADIILLGNKLKDRKKLINRSCNLKQNFVILYIKLCTKGDQHI